MFLPAAVVAVFLVLTLVMVSAFIVPFFMPISRRAALWQMKVRGWIFLAVFVASVTAGALLGADSAKSVAVVMTLPILFGALFFGHGFGAWFGRTARACLTAHVGSQSRRAARTSQLWELTANLS